MTAASRGRLLLVLLGLSWVGSSGAAWAPSGWDPATLGTSVSLGMEQVRAGGGDTSPSPWTAPRCWQPYGEGIS